MWPRPGSKKSSKNASQYVSGFCFCWKNSNKNRCVYWNFDFYSSFSSKHKTQTHICMHFCWACLAHASVKPTPPPGFRSQFFFPKSGLRRKLFHQPIIHTHLLLCFGPGCLPNTGVWLAMLFSGTSLSLGLVTPLVCRLVWLIWFWNPLGFKFSHTTGLHTGVVDLVLAHPWV